MSMQDPLADMFTRIRNGQSAHKTEVTCASSNHKVAVLQVLKDEGYITDFAVSDDASKPELTIELKYYQGKPVIDSLRRISKNSRRVYRRARDLQNVLGGLGIAIVSTSQGVMTGKQARHHGLGGEVIAEVA